MAEPTALKDYMNRESARRLAQQILMAEPKFPVDKFVAKASRGLGPLSFTQRTKKSADALRIYLPDDVPTALKIIKASLPEPLPYSEGMFSDRYWLWPLSDFVRDHAAGHWESAIR